MIRAKVSSHNNELYLFPNIKKDLCTNSYLLFTVSTNPKTSKKTTKTETK